MTIAFWPCLFAIGCPMWLLAVLLVWYLSDASTGWGNAWGYPGARFMENLLLWTVFAIAIFVIALGLTWLAVLFSNFHLEIHHA